MITEKEIIKCEAVFSDDHTHRYLWKRVWNKDKPLVCVLMLKPYASKLFVLSDGARTGLHPLTPTLRSHWELEAFHYPEVDASSEQDTKAGE